MENFQLGFIPKWLCLLYWGTYTVIFIYFFFQVGRRKGKFVNSTFRAVTISAILIGFCLFYCLDTDFFNYMMVATSPEQYAGEGTVEEIYLMLARVINGDYLLFRSLIWGSAVIIVYFACCLFKTSPYVAIMLLLLVFFNVFCYGRISLAMSIFWLGLSINYNSRGWSMRMIGVFFIFLSFVFHRSTAIVIACLGILFLPFNRRNELIISTLVVIIGGGFAYLVLSGEVFSAGSDLAGRIDSYNNQIAEGQWGGLNLVGLFFRVSQYVLFYLVFFIVRSKIIKMSVVPPQILALYKVTWILIVVSTAFLLALGFTPYFYRVINMTLIPLSILVSYLYLSREISPKLLKMVLLVSLIYHNLHFYSVYIHCV